MPGLIIAIILGIFVTGCTHESNNMLSAARPVPESSGQSPRMVMTALSGRSAYYVACASCHETGANGAPLTGDQDAWSTRSPLWQAVLAQHAIDGFMDMPAKGGRVELDDWVVIRATDYMMSLTFPDIPPD